MCMVQKSSATRVNFSKRGYLTEVHSLVAELFGTINISHPYLPFLNIFFLYSQYLAVYS